METAMTAPVVHDTFVLERRYAVSAAVLFQALSDPDKKARWFARHPGGESGGSYSLDFRIGGAELNASPMGKDTPFPGAILASTGHIEDIVPGERVVTSQTMTLAERRISSALITFEIAADGDGARLTLTHQAAFYEGADGPQMRKGGWQALLQRLSDAVERATA
jgi:uncharacterized protein YndB with AHSA1/START domain